MTEKRFIEGIAETAAPSSVSDGEDISAWFDEYGRLAIALYNTSGAEELPAGENFVGETGRNATVFEEVLSLDTLAYAAGDVLADTQELTACLRENGGTATLDSLTLLDKDAQGIALDLLILKTNVSIGAENAAVSVSDANADEILGVIEIAAGDYVDLVNSQIANKNNINMTLKGASGADDLYVAAITRGAPTHTASGITLKLGLIRD